MYKLKQAIAGLFIGLFLLSFSNGCFSAENKKIDDPYLWDFGKVKQGTILKHTFELKNKSDATLIIENLRTSCGCTGSVVSQNKILPGGISHIEVTFNTKGYSGPVKQFVYVHTNSKQEPIIKLTVQAEIIQ